MPVTTTVQESPPPVRLADLSARIAAAVDRSRELETVLMEFHERAIQVEHPQAAPGRLVTREEEVALASGYELLRERVLRAATALGVEVADVRDPLADPSLRARLAAAGERGAVARRCLRELSELRDIYIQRVRYVVAALVDRYRDLGVDGDDLTQEGHLGLLRAIARYDWRRGVRFSTYAKYWIRERVLGCLYDQSRTVRLPAWVQKLWQKMKRAEGGSTPGPELSDKRLRRVVDSRKQHFSIDTTGGDETTTIMAQLADTRLAPEALIDESKELRATIDELLQTLDPREASVLIRRFGLGGKAPESLAGIGADLGVCAERIRQIQTEALQRLRGNHRLAALA